jgi:hypothetical protein
MTFLSSSSSTHSSEIKHRCYDKMQMLLQMSVLTMTMPSSSLRSHLLPDPWPRYNGMSEAAYSFHQKQKRPTEAIADDDNARQSNDALYKTVKKESLRSCPKTGQGAALRDFECVQNRQRRKNHRGRRSKEAIALRKIVKEAEKEEEASFNCPKIKNPPNNSSKDCDETIIMQMNFRSIRSPTRLKAFLRDAEDTNADFIVGVETWLDSSTPTSALENKKYSVISRKDRSTKNADSGKKKKGGGVIVWAKTTTCAVEEQVLSGQNLAEVCVISTWTNFGQWLIIGMYRPPGSTAEEAAVEAIIDNLNRDGCYSKVIVCGDMNDHCKDSLFSTMNKLGLKQCVHQATRQGRTLDMLFTDTLLKPKIDIKPSISDHHSVISTFKACLNISQQTRRCYFDYKNANWSKLNTQLFKRLAPYKIKKLSLHDAARLVDKEIWKAINEHVPIQQPPSNDTKVSWWTSSCEKAHADFVVSPTPSNKQAFSDELKKAYSLHAAATRSSLDKIPSGSKKFWQMIKQKLNISNRSATRIPAFDDGNGNLKTPKETAQALADFFHTKFQPNKNSNHIYAQQNAASSDEDLELPTISRDEFSALLGRIDESKSCGADNITPNFLRRAAKPLGSVLQIIYNKMRKSCEWPKLWKCCRIIPLFKKGSRKQTNNYRPVCLIPILSMIIEAQLAASIAFHCEMNNLFPACQFAYRANHSTGLLAATITHDATTSLATKNDFILVSEDIAGAYDKVSHKTLNEAITNAKLSLPFRMLLTSFIRGRKAQVVIAGDESRWFNVMAGLPQGSPLACQLWILCFIKPCEAASSCGARAYVMADDINYSANNETQINETANAIHTACQDSGHQLEPSKRQKQEFVRRGVSTGEEQRVVGIWFDPGLTMKSHINHMLAKAAPKIGRILALRQLISLPRAISLYKTFVLCHLEYGSLAVMMTASEAQQQRLDDVQSSFLKRIGTSENVLDSLKHRRHVAFGTVMFKTVVLKSAPAPLIQRWQPASEPILKRSTRRQEKLHPYQVKIQEQKTDHKAQRNYAHVLDWFNSLPNELFEQVNNADVFKKRLNIWLRLSKRYVDQNGPLLARQ